MDASKDYMIDSPRRDFTLITIERGNISVIQLLARESEIPHMFGDSLVAAFSGAHIPVLIHPLVNTGSAFTFDGNEQGRNEFINCLETGERPLPDEDVQLEPAAPVNALAQHAGDYKPNAYHDYTLAELGQWIALLTKRAFHRSTLVKATKDLHDARNYYRMMGELLDKADLAVEQTAIGNAAIGAAA